MKNEFDVFTEISKETFKFLKNEYGFYELIEERESYGVYLTYKNNTTAVRISYEPMEGGVFVLLARLVNGEIPKDPIFIKPDTELNSFYLDDLVKLRKPDILVESKPQIESSQEEVRQYLIIVSDQLRECAGDVLSGKFNVFRELDRVVKDRQKELNQA